MFVSNFKLRAWILKKLFNFRETLDCAELHPAREMKKRALQESVGYIQENMIHALALETAREVLEIAINEAPNGQFCEFGVYKGGSIRFIANKIKSQVIHGFDSFEGLPENWRGGAGNAQKGAFSIDGKLPKVPKNVTLHKGLFNETIPRWMNEHSGSIALIHMDCDLYSSTKTVLSYLQPRIQPGTIIVFDEYFNYPNWQQHEFKAFREFTEEYGIIYDYLSYSNRQVAVKITGIKKKLNNGVAEDLEQIVKNTSHL